MGIAVFCCLTLSILAVCIIATLIGWSVHLSMTKDDKGRENCGWGSYKEFVELFKTYELKREYIYSDTFYGKNSKIHASIITFNRKGMLLPYFDWIMVQIFLYKEKKKEKIKIGKFKDL